MGSNTSQRKAQTIILAAKVAEYQAWWLIADCGSCGPRDIPLATFLPEQTISQVLRRLRCASCRGKVASAALCNALPGWRGVWCGSGGREPMGEQDSQLQEPLSRVPLEPIRPPDIALHRLDPLMPAHFHHPEHVGARLGRAGQEPGPQAVASELVRI